MFLLGQGLIKVKENELEREVKYDTPCQSEYSPGACVQKTNCGIWNATAAAKKKIRKIRRDLSNQGVAAFPRR